MMLTDDQVRRKRLRLKNDFAYYAEKCLKILTKAIDGKPASVASFQFNPAQRIAHNQIEAQRERVGYVRAIILKGRQQGISTYTEGRFYWKTTNNRGEKTFILTHQQQATTNLFGMVERYHNNLPVFVRPHVGKSNAKELEFPRLDSKYQVATAGSKGAGRSATLTNVHGSEVAFWEDGEAHLSGMLQAVPLAPGTEVILESTANGVGDVFHKQWQLAESGQSDFIAIFIPWFVSPEYYRKPEPDFEVNGDRESVPEGELTEAEYQGAFKLSDGQILWRRKKIIELGGGERGFYEFKKEYPATADEAFQSSSAHSLLSRRSVVRARKSNVATEGPLIIGVDPAGDGETSDRTAIIRRRTRRAFGLQTLTKLNTMQLARLIFEIIKKERPARVFIDVGGLGVGIVDRLNEMPGTAGIVVPVNFGEAANSPDRYLNRRTEMYHELSAWLDDPGGANIPDTDEVQADLLATVPDDDTSNGQKRLKSKRWMAQKGIRSPDIADALALTFAAPVNGDLMIGTTSASEEFDPVDYAHGSGDFSDDGPGSSYSDFDVFS